jgi:hypothetical protein
MQTAFIHVISAPSGGYEARLDVDWDGVTVPGPDAPCVSFDAGPLPPEGFEDCVTFMLETEGVSRHFGVLGQALHNLLIKDDIHELLSRARGRGRLRLLLRVDPAELDSLPWELMREGDMLTFTNASLPVARVAASYSPDGELPEMCWPLRVMLVVASKDPIIKAQEEIDYIRDAFRKVCGLVDLEVVWFPDRARLRRSYRALQPHVFHFVGHGGVDDDLGGYLKLEPEEGGAYQWTATNIRDDLDGGALRLAVLNACQSGAKSEHAGTRAAARGLAELRAPAVIAMQGPIWGRAAANFAKGMYEALAEGMALDVAVARGRVAITDVAQANQREYALPSLIMGGHPERVLDLSMRDLSGRLAAERLKTVLSFVDRAPGRRQLSDRLRPGPPVGPRIFTVTGPYKAGKGSLVRWSLGLASVQGCPVALVDLSNDKHMDSVDVLKELADVLSGRGVDALQGPLDSFQASLAAYRAEEKDARARGVAYGKNPLDLYQELSNILEIAAADQTLVIGIDGLTSVDISQWQTHTVPGLAKPIARGLVGNVRLIAALPENERLARFPPQHFDQSETEDIPIELFPSKDFVDLISQWLRAQDYPRASFMDPVQQIYGGIKPQGYWDTGSFELFDRYASTLRWPREP